MTYTDNELLLNDLLRGLDASFAGAFEAPTHDDWLSRFTSCMDQVTGAMKAIYSARNVLPPCAYDDTNAELLDLWTFALDCYRTTPEHFCRETA